uniref:Uncharacterized protein n=1 Tax=Romanomermis culicivorax TaxID=13658 RepID=A0A915KN48_ROMCU
MTFPEDISQYLSNPAETLQLSCQMFCLSTTPNDIKKAASIRKKLHLSVSTGRLLLAHHNA